MPNLLCAFAPLREQKEVSRKDAKTPRSSVYAFPPFPCHAELVSASIVPHRPKGREAKWTLKQVQGDGLGFGG